VKRFGQVQHRAAPGELIEGDSRVNVSERAHVHGDVGALHGVEVKLANLRQFRSPRRLDHHVATGSKRG
jgi:hypothetical protein